jgi:hypothetical protein
MKVIYSWRNRTHPEVQPPSIALMTIRSPVYAIADSAIGWKQQLIGTDI